MSCFPRPDWGAKQREAKAYNKATEAGALLRGSRRDWGSQGRRVEEAQRVVELYQDVLSKIIGPADGIHYPVLKADLADIYYYELGDADTAASLLDDAVSHVSTDWVWPLITQLFPQADTYPDPLAQAVQRLYRAMPAAWPTVEYGKWERVPKWDELEPGERQEWIEQQLDGAAGGRRLEAAD